MHAVASHESSIRQLRALGGTSASSRPFSRIRKGNMSSQKRIDANKRNATRSTGPRTQGGKERVKMNAFKHGIFARQFIVSEQELPDYEAMRQELRNQFPPVTPLRDIASEKICWAAWNDRRAVALNTHVLDVLLDHVRVPDTPPDGAEKDAISAKFHAGGKTDLRQHLRILKDLRGEVDTYGFTHVDKWRDSIINCFGLRFYKSLTDWPVMSKSVILQALHLCRHAAIFKKPLPPLESDTEATRLILDPLQSSRMVIKLIDVEIDHLEQLQRTRAKYNPSEGPVSMDLSLRYLVTTSRELERRVDWYRSLEKRGL
jgi:hypothetical protein